MPNRHNSYMGRPQGCMLLFHMYIIKLCMVLEINYRIYRYISIVSVYKLVLKVRWQTVLWGLGLQFIFALLILRSSAGLAAFQWLGDQVSGFLSYTDAGSRFTFGESYMDHFFVFKASCFSPITICSICNSRVCDIAMWWKNSNSIKYDVY